MEKRALDGATAQSPLSSKKAKTSGMLDDEKGGSDKPNAGLDHLYQDDPYQFAGSEDSSKEGDYPHGAEVHETILQSQWTAEIMTTAFWCDGLKLWDADDIIMCRNKHQMDCSPTHSEMRHVLRQKVSWVLPTHGGLDDKIKEELCGECYKRLKAHKNARAAMEQEAMRQEEDERRRFTQQRQKQQRERAVVQAQGIVARNERKYAAGEMNDQELLLWNFKINLEKLPKTKLTKLCKANFIAGADAKTKSELAWILMKFKHHGGPGQCPTCLKRPGSRSQTANGLVFVYSEDIGLDDILAEPERVECKSGGTPFQARCTYKASAQQHLTRNMLDVDGILKAVE